MRKVKKYLYWYTNILEVKLTHEDDQQHISNHDEDEY